MICVRENLEAYQGCTGLLFPHAHGQIRPPWSLWLGPLPLTVTHSASVRSTDFLIWFVNCHSPNNSLWGTQYNMNILSRQLFCIFSSPRIVVWANDPQFALQLQNLFCHDRGGKSRSYFRSPPSSRWGGQACEQGPGSSMTESGRYLLKLDQNPLPRLA